MDKSEKFDYNKHFNKFNVITDITYGYIDQVSKSSKVMENFKNKSPNIEYLEKLKVIEDNIIKESNELSENIKRDIYSKINNIQDISSVQMFIASYRQLLVDSKFGLKAKIRRIEDKLLMKRKSLYYNYKKGDNFRLNDSEINKHINADLEHISNLSKILEQHLIWHDDTIAGLDKANFMVKYLIDQQKFLHGQY